MKNLKVGDQVVIEGGIKGVIERVISLSKYQVSIEFEDGSQGSDSFDIKFLTKIIKLKLDFSNFMRSHESAFISIISPTDRRITIYKKHVSLFTEEELALWAKIKLSYTLHPYVEVTLQEMETMLIMSKIPYFATKR